MLHAPRLRRGAVFARGKQAWLVWDPEPLSPICLPIAGNTVPRTRWDYVIRTGELSGFGGFRWMVRCRAPQAIDTTMMALVAQMSEAGVIALTRQYAQAMESQMTEARYRVSAL